MRAISAPTTATSGSKARLVRSSKAAIAVAAGIAGVSVLALPALAQSRAEGPSSAAVQVAPGITATYSFTTLDDSADLTFNQLLGINDLGKIAGYFGSGMSAAHPNQGYTISAYSGTTFTSENYPGSVQTQVTGLNDMGKTVGFYVDAAGNNFGFYMKNGVFSSFSAPGAGGKTRTTQLLGVNNEGMAVGFYNDAKGNAHGFELDTKTGAYSQLRLSGAVQLTASAINDDGDVAGFFVDAKNITKSFVVENGMVETLAVPGASATQAFGINDSDEVVGQYTLGKATHGFLWQNGRFVTIDDPAGQGTTTVNGINNLGDLVGFYTDSANNTDGFVAQPQYLHTGA